MRFVSLLSGFQAWVPVTKRSLVSTALCSLACVCASDKAATCAVCQCHPLTVLRACLHWEIYQHSYTAIIIALYIYRFNYSGKRPSVKRLEVTHWRNFCCRRTTQELCRTILSDHISFFREPQPETSLCQRWFCCVACVPFHCLYAASRSQLQRTEQWRVQVGFCPRNTLVISLGIITHWPESTLGSDLKSPFWGPSEDFGDVIKLASIASIS